MRDLGKTEQVAGCRGGKGVEAPNRNVNDYYIIGYAVGPTGGVPEALGK
jgi:hypothetical protein